MKSKLEKIPLFFLTIPAFFLLYNNNYYFGLLDWSLIGSDLLLNICYPFLLLVLLQVITRSWHKAGLVIGIFLIIFYFFQPLHELLKSLPVLRYLAKYIILLPFMILFFAGFVFYLRINKSPFRKSFFFLNLLFLVLVVYELAAAVFNASTGKKKEHDLADQHKKISNEFRVCDTCSRPDIYFLIFDEYTNQKTLNAEFKYNNTELISFLRSKGFYVADDSRSNYNYTHMSLSSEMNFNYLPGIDSGKLYYARDFLQAAYTVEQNELCMMLRKEGYNIENYSIFNIEGAPSHTLRPLRKQHLAFILNQTLPGKIDQDIGWNFRRVSKPATRLNPEEKSLVDQDNTRFKQTVDGVIKSVKRNDNSPLFTYAHFLMPHPPYYYDSTGKRLPELYSYYYTDNKDDYLQQLVYANKFIIKPLIDSIFFHSKRPFLIILQGDHGYRDYLPGKQMLELENLNAIYFPDRDYHMLYPSISSVNTFRVVFNKYFNAQFPLLKDSSFYLIRNLDK